MMGPFTLTDIIFLVVIFIFAVIAAAKGFIKDIFGKLCWIFGLIAAFFLHRKLLKYMNELVHNETVSLVLCFVLIFVVVFLIVKIIQTALEKIFDGEIMKGLDRALGFFFGILEGFVVVFAGLFILTYQPWFDISKIFEGSFIYSVLLPLIIKSQDSIPSVTGEVVLAGNYFSVCGVV